MEASGEQAEEEGVAMEGFAAAMPDLRQAISAPFLDRVSIGPPEDWVTIREPEPDFSSQTDSQPSCLLLDRQYHAAKHESYQHTVQRLKTMQAVHQSAQWSLLFDPATQRVVIHGLRVCRAEAVTEQAQEGRFRLLQREGNLEHLILDGRVTIVVLLDDIRVGDLLDVSFTIHNTPRLFPENFYVYVPVPEAMAVKEFHTSVRFPTERPVQWKSSSIGLAPQVREWEGEKEWIWTLNDLKPINLEPRMPSWRLPTLWLQISDITSWETLATELAASWQEEPLDAELGKVAAEIMASTSNPAERVERALTLVQDEIRYLSVDIELGGYTPSPPGTVLQRRFGDCKDKSFLLAHLLRALGIPARPVLVSAALRQSVKELLPAPIFDHCVVEYDLGDQRRWIDATISLQGGGALGRAFPDLEVGLPVGPDSTGLNQVPDGSKPTDRYSLRETFRPDTAGGTSVLEVIVSTAGGCADDLRRSFANKGAKEMAKERMEYYRQQYPGLSRIDSIQWQDNRAENEFILADTFELPQMLTRVRGSALLALQCKAHLINSVLALPEAATRKYPMEFSPPHQIEHSIDVDFPEMMRIDIKPDAHQAAAFQYRRETRRCSTLFSLRTLTKVITPHELAAHRAMVQKVVAGTSLIFRFPLGLPVSRRGRQPAVLSPSSRESSGSSHPTPLARSKETTAKTSSAGEPVRAGSPTFHRPMPAHLGAGGSAENRKSAFVPSISAETGSSRRRTAEKAGSRARSGPRSPRRRMTTTEVVFSIVAIGTVIFLATMICFFFLH